MDTYLKILIASGARAYPVCMFISEETIPAASAEDHEVRG